jgi:hypothetical protein
VIALWAVVAAIVIGGVTFALVVLLGGESGKEYRRADT